MQLANTAFVQAAIAALVASSPAALDTLNELAAALGNDPNFATTMTNALAGKMDKAANGKDIADVSEFLKNLGLGEGSALPVGVPVPWPLPTPPLGWLKYNGAPFDKNLFPKLATVYPSGILPDLRGEFIRGWDDGRGLDPGRLLISAQGDAIRNITGTIPSAALYGFEQDATGALYGMNGFAHGGGSLAQQSAGYGIGFSASSVVPTAAENRPHNVAFNYIVRAA